MKLAVMQPYLFPYIGYFQLIHAVDTFVVYDDVNFINRGWINRNNILAKDKAELITMQLVGASQNKLINQISVGANRQKLLKNIAQKYSKALYYRQVFPLVEGILRQKESNLATFLAYSLQEICCYLEVKPNWVMSSDINKDEMLKGQDKILNICESLDATHYINPPGGKHLYDRDLFEKNGIKLSFIETTAKPYQQFKQGFVSHLSIIDVMMFNDKEIILNEFLNGYSFMSEGE